MSKEIQGDEPASSDFPSIIVRAYDDEPIVLYAIKMQDNGHHVNVGRVPPDAPIGWPLADAFDYDTDAYADLVEAYEQKDKDQLNAIYAQLRAKPREFVATLSNKRHATLCGICIAAGRVYCPPEHGHRA